MSTAEADLLALRGQMFCDNECYTCHGSTGEDDLMALRGVFQASRGCDFRHESHADDTTTSNPGSGSERYGTTGMNSSLSEASRCDLMSCDEDNMEDDEEEIPDLDEEDLEQLAEQINKTNPHLKSAMRALMHGYRRDRLFRHRAGGYVEEEEGQDNGEDESDAAADKVYDAMLRASGGEGKTYGFADFGECS